MTSINLEMTPQTAARAYYAPRKEQLRLEDAELYDLFSLLR